MAIGMDMRFGEIILIKVWHPEEMRWRLKARVSKSWGKATADLSSCQELVVLICWGEVMRLGFDSTSHKVL